MAYATTSSVEYLIAEIQSHGVTSWEIDMQHKHPRLCFEWQGRPFWFVVPSTPSDRRWHLNALTDLRKRMGVRRIITKSQAPAKQRNPTVGPTRELTTFQARPDPFAVLAALMPKVEAREMAARSKDNLAMHGCDARSLLIEPRRLDTAQADARRKAEPPVTPARLDQARWYGRAAFFVGLGAIAPATYPAKMAEAFGLGWWGAHWAEQWGDK